MTNETTAAWGAHRLVNVGDLPIPLGSFWIYEKEVREANLSRVNRQVITEKATSLHKGKRILTDAINAVTLTRTESTS